MTFITPVLKHWLKQVIAQWGQSVINQNQLLKIVLKN